MRSRDLIPLPLPGKEVKNNQKRPLRGRGFETNVRHVMFKLC